MRHVIAIALLLAAVPVCSVEPTALVACPDSGDDVKNRKALANEHYRSGQELYADGEYELAIGEFRAAYCLVPVPEAIFNIAQAYERLVDYEHAVALFDGYVRMLPPSSKEEIATVEHRVKALRRLPARIRVSTEPPGAELRLEGPEGALVAKANAEPLRLAAGRYKMRVELPGYEPLVEDFHAEIGQPYTYSFRLVAQTGTLRIATQPGDARIVVDDRIAGIGRVRERLPVGPHQVDVEAEERPTERRTVVIAADDELALVVTMKPPRPKNGKLELLISSTAMSISEGGLLGSTFADSDAAIIATSLGLGAADFILSYFVLPSELPMGTTSAMLGGRLWGGIEGSLIASSLPGVGLANVSLSGSILATVGGSIAFEIAAGFIAHRIDLSAGDAAVINSGGIWGCVLGGLTVVTFPEIDKSVDGPVVLIGLNLGLIGGAVLSNYVEWTRGHAALIDLAGVAGLAGGLALSTVVDESAVSQRYALGGMVVGLAAGVLLTRNMDSDPPIVPATGVALGPTGEPIYTFGVKSSW